MSIASIIPFFRLGYVVLAGCIIVLDQLTKAWALTTHAYVFNTWLACTVQLNRGIALGVLHSDTLPLFNILVTVLIACVIGCVILHFFYGLRAQQFVVGHVFIIAGALSNFFDRLWHGGVVDFIAWHWKDYYFPVFNIADIAIVVGVVSMLYALYKE